MSASVLKMVLAPVAGALAAFVVMGGLVWSQTQAPEQNPVSKPIFDYGDTEG